MCATVKIKGKIINTVRDLLAHIGECEYYYTRVNPDACLCQVNMEKTFANHHIAYKVDIFGEYEILSEESELCSDECGSK